MKYDEVDLLWLEFRFVEVDAPEIMSKRRNSRLLFTDHVIGEAELEKRKPEGMVAKRSDSSYVGGRTRDWLKIKTTAGRDEMRKRSESWNP